jgi:threonine aldolase
MQFTVGSVSRIITAMIYSFYDDYSEGVHPEIIKYIADNNFDQQRGYSTDEYCTLASDRLRNAFGLPDADIHFMPNGTIANVIGLASMLKPFEGVISPASGHINTHEAGALEATGHKILWVDAHDGKLTPERIDSVMNSYEDEHTVVPRVVYLTQSTELGTVYTKSELEEVITHSKRKGLYVYIDGARLAMALASKSCGMALSEFGNLGADMFYVGGTKNGGLYGEAMIILNPELKPNFRNHMKQRGALMAKGRFMGQQFARFFDEDNLWLTLAQYANDMAAKLYKGLSDLGVPFDLDAPANQIFPILPTKVVEKLEEDYGFYRWKKVDESHTMIRLVCSWATDIRSLDAFIARVGLELNQAGSND